MSHNIGSYLRHLRQSRQLSQTQAAQQAGISRVTLNRWERGIQQPRAVDLESLLLTLNTSQAERQQALEILNTPQARGQMRDRHEQVGTQLGIGPMPHGGDLLRGLRMRRGFAQDETARRVGVTVRTLRRWERFEVWPSPTQLHTLCYTLGAQPEEMIALTAGDLAPAAGVEVATLEELKDRGHQLHFYARGWRAEALKELAYLTMEAQAWPLVAHSGNGWQILSELYCFHAYHLSCEGRFQESSVYANRALDLVPYHEPSSGDQALASITSARSTVQRGTPSAVRRGLDMLRQWLPVTRDFEYQAWILSDMAAYTVQLGDVERGLELSKHARLIASRCSNRHELYNRELDEVQLLLSLKKPMQALDMIQRDRKNPCSDQVAKFLLQEAEAYLDLDQPSRAHVQFTQALQLITDRKMIRLESQAQKLALRF